MVSHGSPTLTSSTPQALQTPSKKIDVTNLARIALYINADGR
jgi:hypothetical protein